MKKFIFVFAFQFLFSLFLFPHTHFNTQNIDEFVSKILISLEQKNIQGFLDAVSLDVKEREEKELMDRFDRLQVERVSVFKAYMHMGEDDKARLNLRVIFENLYSMTIEMWTLDLSRIDECWQINEKKVLDSKSMYRIKIPSDRVERAELLEVKHADLKITFKDAVIFYDNIPEIETALLVIGKGQLHFSPSVQRERHQLEMVFNDDEIEDRIEYAYMRFSDYFFKRNVRIIKRENIQHVNEAEYNRAYSLFTKHYSQSFTIEDSLNKELLSFLPQGDAATISFKGNRIGDFTYIYSPFSREEVTFYQRKKERVVNLYSPHTSENKRKMFISLGQKFNVKSYEIDIDFIPKDYYFSAKAKIEVESNMDNLDMLKFKLNPNLEILRINDTNNNKLFYTRDRLRKTLYVYLLRSPPVGEMTSIEVYYRGVIKPLEATSDVIFEPQYEETFYMLSPKYSTYLYSKETLWYPAPSDDEYFTARIKIIVPPKFQVISNGLLIEHSERSDLENVEDIEKMGSTISVFESKKQVKYLSFIVGKFLKVKENTDGIPIQYYRSQEIRTQRLDIFDETKKIFKFYESKFGPYPFEKLSIVKRLWRTSGGHSPASFIVLNELPLISGRSRFVIVESPVSFSRWKEYFLAHEIAHQWWGQGVTWKSYKDQWISEGIAQFSALFYLKEKLGEKDFSAMLKKISPWVKKKSEWGPITMGARLSYFDIEAYQSIVYNKCSLVLNMLKDLIGEDLFFRGMRLFFHTHKFSAASTKDFVRSMEEISGKNLESFFDKWFESYLLPEVSVNQTVENNDSGYLLNIKITQQKGPFVFPLWIEWRENGNEVRKKIIVERLNQEFNFELSNKPEKIKINPDKAVPGNFH